MKIGYGPLDADGPPPADVGSISSLLEDLGYEFIWFGGPGDGIMAASIAVTAAQDARLLVELNREIDPLRDAEELAVLDQLSGGRVAVVLGGDALGDLDLVGEMTLALAGGEVRGVRVYPRTAQLTLPIFAEVELSLDVPVYPISDTVRPGAVVRFSTTEEAIAVRDQIRQQTPLAICIGTSEAMADLMEARQLRDEILVDPSIRKTKSGLGPRRLPASDLDSPFHSLT